MQPDVVCITPACNELGESLYWDAEAEVLYWIDAWKAVVHAYEPGTGDRRQTDFAAALGGRPIGSIACREGGGMISGVRGGFYQLDLDTGAARLVAEAETGRPAANRLNDG
jgi:sugar lactone lactonase YvrE